MAADAGGRAEHGSVGLADSDGDTGTDGRAKAPAGPRSTPGACPVGPTRPPAQSSRLCGYPATDQPDLEEHSRGHHEGQRMRVSRRGESHPPPLSGPDVTVSRHPAPTVRPWVNAMSCQWANRPGLY